ncbi:MAG TPA: YciI family protein [Polyangiaceae bacterium]|jgi:hypothetical protein
MRFLIMVPANAQSEAGVLPDGKILREMMAFNKQLVEAGVMLAGEGLHPTSKGARVRFGATKSTVVDGPFTESKELVAGFWIWQCKSKEEAVEWVKRAPFDDGAVIEIRQIFESPELTDDKEFLAEEAKIRVQAAKAR